MTVAILDYDVGNLRSVSKALEYVGVNALVTKNPREARNADALILPGVGAFADAAESFQKSGLEGVLLSAIEKGTPVLGICLGMQLMMAESREFGVHKGLSLFPATIERFGESTGTDALPLKIPHMGWNSIAPNRACPLFDSIEDGAFVYFVHSFRVTGVHVWTAASAIYGGEFTAAVWRNNVFGVQFHPEKSGETGLVILRNFVRIAGSEPCLQDE